MKVILLILLLSPLALSAQKKEKQPLLSNYESGSLVMRNGDTLIGVIKLYNVYEVVKFKNERGGKKKKYDYKDVKRIIKNGDFPNYYEFKVVPGRRFPTILKQLAAGKYYLYTREVYVQDGFDMGFESGIQTPGRLTEEGSYLSLGNGDTVIGFYSEKGRSKMISCPEVAKFIRGKDFDKIDPIEIVNIYNTHCPE